MIGGGMYTGAGRRRKYGTGRLDSGYPDKNEGNEWE